MVVEREVWDTCKGVIAELDSWGRLAEVENGAVEGEERSSRKKGRISTYLA